MGRLGPTPTPLKFCSSSAHYVSHCQLLKTGPEHLFSHAASNSDWPLSTNCTEACSRPLSCRGSPESGPRSSLDFIKETSNLAENFSFSLLWSSHAFLKLTEKQLCVHISSLESVLFYCVLMLHSFVLHTISTRTFCPPGFIRQSITSTPLHPRLPLLHNFSQDVKLTLFQMSLTESYLLS